jgi:beta-lactamase class A
VRARIEGFAGTVSLFARNLDTGKTFGIREDALVRTASTIKLPILVALFQAAAGGKIRWDETLPLKAEDIVSGSGVLREFSPGASYRLRDLANLMIVVSDNTAANLILDRLGADYVNEVMDGLGLPKTRALRKILGDGRDLKPQTSGHSKAGLEEANRRFGIGVSTPREMVALLDQLERGQVVSAEASREIIAILRRQQYKDGIGRRFPSRIVASKSGSLDALRSDVGLVHSDGGRIAIAVTVDGMPKPDYSPDNPGNILISDLAQIIVDGLAR